MQVDRVEHVFVAARVGERDALEAHAIARCRSFGDADARGRARGLLVEVLVEVREVEVVFVHAPYRREAGRHGRLALAKEGDVHGHLAERDRPDHRGMSDPGVGTIEGGGPEEPEREREDAATDAEISVLDEEVREDLLVAVEEERIQVQHVAQNASPANLASARNAGRPPTTTIKTASGEKAKRSMA